MRFFRPSFDAVIELLTAAGLPTDDLREPLEHFLVCGHPALPDGVVGIEIFGREALLRSLVVAETARRRGIGRQLVSAAEDLAIQQSASRVFLLTETAERFFAGLGYVHTDRQKAPAPIRNSRQFSDLCPASAAFMVKDLEQTVA